MKTPQQAEQELNKFARFFGNMLVELRRRDLRLKYEPLTPASREIEFIKHVR